MVTLDRQMIQMELRQRREEGCNVAGLDKRIDDALADDDTVDDAVFKALYDELDGLEPASDFPYQEPSELAAIRESRPDGIRRMTVLLSEDEVRDRIYGAWLVPGIVGLGGSVGSDPATLRPLPWGSHYQQCSPGCDGTYLWCGGL
jgi:hypothetical protein